MKLTFHYSTQLYKGSLKEQGGSIILPLRLLYNMLYIIMYSSAIINSIVFSTLFSDNNYYETETAL